MYSGGPLHMDEQKQDDQLEPTYSSSVPIQDVTLKICRKQWTIGRDDERGSGISMLMARRDDDYDLFYLFYKKDFEFRWRTFFLDHLGYQFLSLSLSLSLSLFLSLSLSLSKYIYI